MPAARLVRTQAFLDPRLAQLSDPAELLYHACWPHLDRDGRCPGDAAWVKSTHPVRARSNGWEYARIEQLMFEWQHTRNEHGGRSPLVLVYTADGIAVCEFTAFRRTQYLSQLRKEQPSSFPPPPQELFAELVAAAEHAITQPATQPPTHADAASPPLVAPVDTAFAGPKTPALVQGGLKEQSSKQKNSGGPPSALSTDPAARRQLELDSELRRICASLADADRTTLRIVRSLAERGVSLDAFLQAEARTLARRESRRRSPLRSEARYFTTLALELADPDEDC